jgi:hypothetical protein
MLILNLAAGKFHPLPMDEDNILMPRYTLNVDTSYFTENTPNMVEDDIISWLGDEDRLTKSVALNMDVFEFMERTRVKFDRVVIYRFLEHVSFTQVEYFIYLVSTVLKERGFVDVIVPNYEQLAELLLSEPNHHDNPVFNFEAHNILLTTELLNEPSCPHASIWTPHRMNRFWQLEGRFRVAKQNPAFKFDDRDIYLRSIMERL